MFNSIVSSPRNSLAPQQALKLANVYLESASNIDDIDLALVLCHDTEVSLYQAKKAIKRYEDQFMIKDIATAYVNLGSFLDRQGRPSEAKASYRKAGKLGQVPNCSLHRSNRITVCR
jgi:tetratricopeptide (TPR) repeat protein